MIYGRPHEELMASTAPSATPGEAPQPQGQFEPSAPLVGASEPETVHAPPPPMQPLGERVQAALYTVGDDDPDVASEQYKMAERANVHPGYAQLAPEEVKRRLAMIEAQRLDLARTAPDVADAITANRDFAVLTKDDLETQQRVGWELAYWAADNTGSLPGWVNRFYLDLYSSFVAGQMTSRTGRIITGENILGGAEGLSLEAAESERLMTVMTPPSEDDSFFMGNLKYLATQAGQRYEKWELYAAGAAMGAAAGAPAGGVGAVPGAITGIGIAAFVDGFGTEAGLAYLDYRREGMDHETARIMALTHGTVAGTVEAFATRYMAAPFGDAFNAVFKTSARQALRELTKTAIVRAGAVGIVKQNFAEATEEAIQRASALLFLELGKMRDDPNYRSRLTSVDGARELASDVAGEFTNAFRNGWFMAALGPGSSTAARLRQHTKSADQLANMSRLIDEASNSKANKRNASLYNQFLNRITGGTDAEFLYIDREELSQVLEQTNLNPDALNQIMPGLGDQFRDSAAEGGTPIKIRTADYITRIGNSVLDEQMRQHVRVSPDGLSLAQVAANAQLADKWVADFNRVADNFEKIEQENAETVGAVEKRMMAELNAVDTAMTQEQKEAAARIYSRAVLFHAQVEGMSVEQFEQKYGLQIKQRMGIMPQPPAAVKSLNQQGIARIDVAYADALSRGDIATAQQMVDAAAQQAMPNSAVRGDGDIGIQGRLLRVFHGSGTTIRRFMYQFTGQGVDQLGSGFYFTTDRPEAVSYTTRRRDADVEKIGGEDRPTVVEAYLDIRNPLRSDQVGSLTRDQVRQFIAAAPEDSRRDGLANWGIDGNTPTSAVLDAYALQDTNLLRALFKIGNDFYGNNTEAFNRAISDILGYDGVVQDFRSDGVAKLHYVAFFPEQIKSAEPATTDEDGNVVSLSRRFNMTSADIFEQALSTRVPTAKGMELAALEDMLIADLEAMMKSDRMVDGNLRIAEELGVPVNIDKTLPKAQQLQQVIQFMVDNLLALHDKMDAQQRERAKLWYVGGRRIVDEMAKRYGITDMQAAAMLAVLSPQKNWFENVSMAFRIGDILSAQREATWNDAVDRAFRKEVADIKASVPIAKSRLEQAEAAAPQDPQQQVGEKAAEFRARMAEWERTKADQLAKYRTDLANWEADLARLDEQIGEAVENGDSTAELRAERAAINRAKPRMPRAPVKAKRETNAEFAARVDAFPQQKKEHADYVAKLRKVVASREKAAARMEAIAESDAIKALRGGQTLGELLETKNLDMAARFVRYLDETGNSRQFAIITPEGGMAGPSQGKDGPLTMRWGSYSTIAKAISVYEDGRVENVHHQIGMAHKVRNFYNNLFDPTNPNAGTIDTHAIAAALLQALGSSSNLVSWGLGSGVSDARLGLHGGYPLVYEAYRQAAQQRGLLVREMQSITWEAVRGLFEAAMKKTLAEPVAKVWARHKAGEITIEQARNEIFALANGIKDPEWVTQPTDLPVTSTYTGASNTAMESVRETSPRESQPATVSFEVAPDPRDTALKQQWKALSAAQRQQISMNVASAIVPQVMAEYGVSAQVTMQTGGWKGDSNVSFAITMPAGPLVRQVGMAIGWVLSQQAVYSFSKTKYTGADRTTMVVVKLADGISPSEIANLYETKLHGTGIMGHSTSGSVMYIAVDSKSGLDAGELANTIATATDNDPRVESVVTLEGWSKEDNVTEKPTTEVERAGAEPTRLVPPAAQRRRLDLWRAEATRLVAEQAAVAGREGGYAVEPAEARGIPPLDGAPSEQGIQGPDPRIVAVARRYAASIGLPFRRQSKYARVDEARAKRIADAYEAMQNNPSDPEVRAAYEDLVRQTKAQYEALVAAGYKFYFFDPDNDPYADQPDGFGNPWNAVRDLRENQRMAVFPTDTGYGTDLSASDYDASQNPLLATTGIMWPYGSLDGEMRPVRANDLFRAVHDAFGHSLEGAGFRARGEENAWQAHVRLFHGPAVAAMTSETRGQNSWLNYGPSGAQNRKAKVEDTVFAEQKVGLMPSWTWEEGRVAEVDYPVEDEGQFNQEMVTPRFYSALETAIVDVKSNALTPDSWRQQIRGLINKGVVKADEYEWSGLEEFLDIARDGGKVTRDEVLNFLRTNGIKVTVIENRQPDLSPETAALPESERLARARITASETAEMWLDAEGDLITQEMRDAFEQYRAAVRNGAPIDVLTSIAEPIDEVLDATFGTSIEGYAEDNMMLGDTDVADVIANPDEYVQYRRWSLPGGTEYREIRITIPVTIPRLARSENLSTADAFEVYEYTLDGVSPAIYTAHVAQLTDGTYEVIKQGWREVFATLDEADAYIRKTLAEDAQGFTDRTSFKSSHWKERNIVVHLRLTTRIDADGKRVLFVEEIQSDWGQQGRANGFRNRAKLAELRKRVRELQARQDELDIVAYAGESLAMDSVEDAILAAIKEYANGESGAADAFAAMSDNELAAKYSLDTSGVARLRTWVQWTINKRDLRTARGELMKMNEAIPSGPFVENTDAWTTLGLKQILIEAVKGKYDRVAFVTGDQTVQHYRDAIVQAVDGVQIVRETDGTYSVNAYKGEETLVEENNIRRDRIAELFGKAGADQLITAADAAGDGTTVEVDSGNLEVGGAGLRKHYGQIVPKNLQKLLKKFGGGQIGTTTLSTSARNFPTDSRNDVAFSEDAARAALEAGNAVELVRLPVGRQQVLRIQVTTANDLDQALLDYGEDFDGMNVIDMSAVKATEAQEQMSFDVTPELVSGLSGGIPLFQEQPRSGNRGAFDPRKLQMILNSQSDVSTFLHEMAHYHLTIMSTIAADPTSSARSRENMDSVLRWFGISGATPADRLARWNAMTLEEQRPYHEQFAYNFEIYMFEGRSPSLEMQSAFEQFSHWLKRIYNEIRTTLNDIYREKFGRDLPILTGEVRQVFDRLLASDDQIARAQAVRNMVPLFLTEEEARAEGMSEQEWADYQAGAQMATREASQELQRRSLSTMQWLGNATSRMLSKLQGEHRELRKEMREEVSAEVRRQTVYRAMRYLRTGVSSDADGLGITASGPHRLDMDALEAMYPEGMKDRPDIARLGTGGRGMMGREGIHPDVVAEVFGYESGDQLVRALLAAKPLDAEIDRVTDERMMAQYGDMVTDKGREEAVERALHNEARGRFVAAEAKVASKATQPVRVMLAAARQAAATILGNRRIRDIKPGEYAAAESRSARDAETAYAKRRTAAQVAQAAYNRVYGELLSAVAAGAMTETQAIAQATEAQAQAQAEASAREAEYTARYGNSDPVEVIQRAKRNQLLQNQLTSQALDAIDEIRKAVKYMRNVLRDENRKRIGADAADQIEAVLERFELRALSLENIDRRKSLAQWIAEQNALGLDVEIPPAIAAEAARVSYRDMSLSEFRELVDTVKQLEHIGKNRMKTLAAARQQQFDEARDEIVQTIEREGAARGRMVTPETARTEIGRRMQSVGRFMASHLKAAIIVQILDGGREGGPLWNYLIRPANDAGDRETQMRATGTEDLSKILAPVLEGEKMGGKGIYFPTVGMHLNREARLVFALNWGNEGNRQRLMGGVGWTPEQVRPVLESLTAEEWNVVQQIWDYFESYRPMIAEKERRIYGKEPEWVEPSPLEVNTADGQTVSLRGGYYPIKYDPMASLRAESFDEAEQARQQMLGAHISATTRRSYTKSRVDEVSGRPLLYSLSGLYTGVNEIIHDLAWHEWLIDANKLMRDEMFDRAVRTRLGPEYKRQLKNWVADVAVGERGATHDLEKVASVMRQSVAAAGLGFSVTSAAVQIVGFNQSIVKVGARHIGRAIMEFAQHPVRSSAEVVAKSKFMADRGRTQFRELNELRNMVRGETLASRRFKLGVYFLMMRMQRMVDIPTWMGAYEKALESGEDDATSVALADQAVIDSQGSGMVKDLSGIERGGALVKLFTVFYTYMNTVYNMAALKGMTERNKAKLAADMLMIFVVPAVLTSTLKSMLKPNEEEDELDAVDMARRLVGESLEYAMGTVLIGRELAQLARMVVGGEPFRDYSGPAGLRVITDVYKFGKQASQLEFDRQFRKAAINLLGDLFGIPSAQINRAIDGIEAVTEGNVEGPIDSVRAVLFGTEK